MKTKMILSIFGLTVVSFAGSTFASECTKYFDGCNTCTVTNGAVACTRMACETTQKPYCIDDAAGDIKLESEKNEKINVDWIPPYNNGEKTYKVDEQSVKSLDTKDSSLIKVNCDTAQVLKALGFNAGTKMFSIGLEDDIYDYSFDLRNCSMRGNKRNTTWTGKPVTEKDALAKAKDFMKTSTFKNKVFSQYGDPIIIAKNGNGGPVLYKADAVRENGGFSGIEIDPTDTGTLEQEYTSFSILFPYTISNKPVYNVYGNRAGISIEVTADGILNVNAQLLPFKGAVRKSEKLSNEEILSFVKRGGNTQFRGNQKEIELQKPERVNVLFNIWRNNTNEVFLSSGIRFGSNVKVDQRSQQPYEMIISDYKIGNSNYGN